MGITREDLTEFQRFAETKLASGGVETLQQLLDEWNRVRDYEDSINGIRESVQQYESGDYLPLDEAFEAVRRDLDQAT